MRHFETELSDNLYYILQLFPYNRLWLSINFRSEIEPCPARDAPLPRQSNIPSLFPLQTIRAHASQECFAFVLLIASDEVLHPSKYIRSHENPPHIGPPIDSRCGGWIVKPRHYRGWRIGPVLAVALPVLSTIHSLQNPEIFLDSPASIHSEGAWQQSLAKTGMPRYLANASASVLFPVPGKPKTRISFILSPWLLLLYNYRRIRDTNAAADL